MSAPNSLQNKTKTKGKRVLAPSFASALFSERKTVCLVAFGWRSSEWDRALENCCWSLLNDLDALLLNGWNGWAWASQRANWWRKFVRWTPHAVNLWTYANQCRRWRRSMSSQRLHKSNEVVDENSLVRAKCNHRVSGKHTHTQVEIVTRSERLRVYACEFRTNRNARDAHNHIRTGRAAHKIFIRLNNEMVAEPKEPCERTSESVVGSLLTYHWFPHGFPLCVVRRFTTDADSESCSRTCALTSSVH